MLEVIKESHLDHGLTSLHIKWLLKRFADRSAFFIETIELPPELEEVECGLYGPDMGDEPVEEERVHYAVRGERKCASRMVKELVRKTRSLTIIAGPDQNGRACVLYTSYGGLPAPREPGDLTLKTWDEVTEARAFWKVHALAAGKPVVCA